MCLFYGKLFVDDSSLIVRISHSPLQRLSENKRTLQAILFFIPTSMTESKQPRAMDHLVFSGLNYTPTLTPIDQAYLLYEILLVIRP